MAITSAQQFKRLIESAAYSPRRDRDVSGGASAEMLEEGGDSIQSVRVKFYIEDDGAEWDSTLPHPEMVWDLKSISANSIVDSGNANKNVSLKTNNVKESDDGLEFFESENSRIYSEAFPTSGLDFSEFCYSAWFTPLKLQTLTYGNLFALNDGTGAPQFAVSLMQNENHSEQFQILFYAALSDGNDQSYVITQEGIPGIGTKQTQWDWGN
ncbi:MAG: hypothetical protein ACW96X_05340, partial [Promethearchaeota archaeon]